ncbi:MAG: Gfo/Idh/MocA family oxidoreductase [Desulfobacterales bacterium]|nr:Gfo/Idh/MocA family oxidoreductase [Desulfobacterales bacterium]
MSIRTAIVGMGKMGKIRKQILDTHPAFEVVAICDRERGMKEAFPGLTFVEQWRDLLDLRLDAIVVCAYNNVAPDIVCSALDAGLHVFCEKPPGRCLADIERVIAHEKAAGGRVLKYGFNHRFHYAVMEAKAIIDSGRYGPVLCARGTYGKAGGLGLEKNWRLDKELAGGGILLDQGIHMLDLMCYLIGDFTQVKSFVENLYWKAPLEDNAFVLMKTDNGQVAMVHSSATQWKHKFSLELFMADGYVSINGILTSTRSYGDETITFARKQFEDVTFAFGHPREEIIYFDRDDSWEQEMNEFYACINGEKKRPQGSSEDARKVMELVEKIYAAG